MSENYNLGMLAMRPEIYIELNGSKNEEELFMHQTLRPLLKLQHEKIIQLIESAQYFEKHKCQRVIAVENTNYLKTFLIKNIELKQQLIGLILGVFTTDELTYFIKNKTIISKRMIEMMITRYLSN